MQGAEYRTDEERFALTEKLQANLPNVNFKWVHKKQRQEELEKQGIAEGQLQQISIPVYLNTMRRALITPVKIDTHGIPQYVWYQRGVALFAWSN
jgi:Dynein heavy chain C-terminal domain